MQASAGFPFRIQTNNSIFFVMFNFSEAVNESIKAGLLDWNDPVKVASSHTTQNYKHDGRQQSHSSTWRHQKMFPACPAGEIMMTSSRASRRIPSKSRDSKRFARYFQFAVSECSLVYKIMFSTRVSQMTKHCKHSVTSKYLRPVEIRYRRRAPFPVGTTMTTQTDANSCLRHARTAPSNGGMYAFRSWMAWCVISVNC